MKSLRDVKKGETVTIIKLHGEGALRRRLMDMGLIKGSSVFVRKVAPLGDPIEVQVRGYELSIRKADAELIEVSGQDAQEESSDQGSAAATGTNQEDTTKGGAE